MILRDIKAILNSLYACNSMDELLFISKEIEAHRIFYRNHEFNYMVEEASKIMSFLKEELIEKRKQEALSKIRKISLEKRKQIETDLADFSESLINAAISFKKLNWSIEDYIENITEDDAKKGIDSVNEFLKI
ncbi:MAG: hypothetical protein AAF348_07415 [Bacteroidota bacterium]